MTTTNSAQKQDQRFAAECEAYRKLHGSSSLIQYAGRSSRYVCMHHDSNGAVLIELCTHKRIELTDAEFKKEFYMFFMDESAFYFGSEAVQTAANEALDSFIAATRFCLVEGQKVPKAGP